MLSETFEYVDPKKKYRYISEQVSHHPVRLLLTLSRSISPLY
jgi:hypothetical protein